MQFDVLSAIPPQVQSQLDTVARNREKLINAAKIQEESTAEHVAMNLCREIIKYQESLPDTEDVAMMLVQFGQSVTILVKGIGYSGRNLVCFHGEDIDGKPLELIQHISQLNFLLRVFPKAHPEAPKRKIGFVGQVGEEK